MMGFPKKSLMFFRGMRLLPPRAGMIANLITEISFDGLNHVVYFVITQAWKHRNAYAMAVIVFGMWQVSFFPTLIAVIWHQVTWDVMNLRKNRFRTKKFIQAQSIVDFDDV